MDANPRPSGIEGLGDMSWGTHFCLFYETKEDLLGFFIPFFKAGLEQQEFCLCVASEPLVAEEAERAMRDAFPDFERYVAAGQIEITPHTDWYLKNGHFDEQRVLKGWIDKLDQVLAKGFSGLRFAANFLLDKPDWESFVRFEAKLEDRLHDLRIKGLCAYNLNRYSAANMLDVVRHHQFTLVRRDGVWEPLEGAQLKRAHDEVLKLNAELEKRVAERTGELATANEKLKSEMIERKRSEARLQAAIDAADIVLWERDLSSGQITWLGHHEKLLGFAPGELDDNTLASFEKRVHPEDIEELRRIRQRALEQRSEYSHEYRVVWPDGSIHWIRAQGRFIYNEAGQPVRLYGAVLDITERKQVERSLQETNSKLQLILNNSPLPIVGEDANARVTAWNKAAERLFGWTEQEVLGQRCPAVPSEETDEYLKMVRQVMQGETYLGLVRYRQKKSGSLLNCSISVAPQRNERGEPIGVTFIVEDITERKQAETTIRSLLHISENLHRNLETDKLLEALIIEAMKLTDSELGWAGLPTENGMTLVRHISHDFEVLPFEYTWAPGVGWPGWVLVHKVPYISNDAQSDRTIVPEIRERFGVRSGIDTPIPDARGEVIGFFEVNNKKNGARFTESDVEKLVAVSRIASIALQNARLFEQVQDAREQLEALSRRLLEVQESERRALTTELHDRVGQNLTGLSILLQNLKASLSGEAARNLAQKFDDAQILVQDTTRHIRDIMAELYLPELEDHGLAAALETYADRVASRANLDLIVDLPEIPLRLSSDVRVALFRAAQEAISNVLKHADATQLEISLERENGRVRLSIEDDGQGFEPNAPSQKEAPSWGLKIMRERIESIGGKVEIESEPGEGTRVTFEIERFS